jgi:ATP-dependent DNA helicase RecG
VYIRVGSSTKKADEYYIEELHRENRRINYDEEIIYVNADTLSKELLKQVYERPSTKQLINEKILANPVSDLSSTHPTIAGLLCFNEHPEQHIPGAYIICSRFNGIEGREIIQREEIFGNLDKQARESTELIKSWLTRDYKLQGLKLEGKTIIPIVALREAIINALMHRKYSIPGAIKIALYDDRLEIFSPGAFPAPIDIAHLGDGTTYLRNSIVAKIFRKLKLVERMGTGIKLIFDECKKTRLKKPEYIEGGDFVKLIFYFAQIKDPTEDDLEAILRLLESKKESTVAEISIFLNISRNTVTKKINQLINAGKVLRQGKGPATKFILAV